MIQPGAIKKKANAIGVRDQQIEKDYILSWILLGISKHKQLSNAIVFKGGTVLKKVYFENYRFSEDLDFTLVNTELNNEQIINYFSEMFDFVRVEANIILTLLEKQVHQDGSLNFHIGYIGPLGGQGTNKKVKVDISYNELLVYKPVLMDVFISYTDIESYQILCYTLEEVLLEKMRSVIQRMQARDFYDIWYLLAMHGMGKHFNIADFEMKCKHKKIVHTHFAIKISERLPQYKARWTGSLSEQIKELPNFENVARTVQRQIKQMSL
jgi:predicted nucleotidyltransferase component of viral defense system